MPKMLSAYQLECHASLLQETMNFLKGWAFVGPLVPAVIHKFQPGLHHVNRWIRLRDTLGVPASISLEIAGRQPLQTAKGMVYGLYLAKGSLRWIISYKTIPKQTHQSHAAQHVVDTKTVYVSFFCILFTGQYFWGYPSNGTHTYRHFLV